MRRSRILPVFLFGLLMLAASNAALSDEIALDFGDGRTNESGPPAPWRLLGNPRSGQPDFRLEKDDQHGHVVRLHARGDESDGIYRSAAIDLRKTPYINFSWKVTTHPDGQVGTSRDDQAVQVQLNFGRRGFRRRVLSYGYDAKASTGRWYDDSSFVAVNKVLVLNSGTEQLGEWISHSRNVAKDYRSCYRSNPPRVQNVSIFCDSNDSNSESLSYCTKITFSREPLNGPEATGQN
jgi:hypothetical protein